MSNHFNMKVFSFEEFSKTFPEKLHNYSKDLDFVCEKPANIIFINFSTNKNEPIYFSKFDLDILQKYYVFIDDGCCVDVVDDFYLKNISIFCFLDSTLHIKYDSPNINNIECIKRSFYCYKNSSLSVQGLLIEAKYDYAFNCLEQKAKVDCKIGIMSESSNISMNVEQNHKAKNTKSNLIVKSVLSKNSRFLFNGKIYIGKGLKDISSSQINKNLLLDKKSQVNSMPVLEILSNEVECNHGCVCGHLEPDYIYYCQLLGISRLSSIKLLSDAFLNDVS